MEAKIRQSNIELLRLVTMFLILAVHANFFSLGAVSKADISIEPLTSAVRIFLEAACMIGVNVFILISGWFGIKASVKGLVAILFQVCFYMALILGIFLLLGIDIPWNGVGRTFNFGIAYWFIPSYIILYIVSPVLNQFVDHASKRSFTIFIIAFFIAEMIYGYSSTIGNYNEGHHAMHFIGIYMLARYIRLYPNKLTSLNKHQNFLIYLLFTFIAAGLYFVNAKMKYLLCISPYIIISSVYFFLTFTKMNFQNKAINWMATSIFSIYIVHLNVLISPLYKQIMLNAYNTMNGLLFLGYAFIVILLIGLGCILVDKFRIVVWNAFCKIPGVNKILAISFC